MSTSYQYASLAKREWFSTSAFGGSGNFRGLGLNLSARAIELLLISGKGRHAPEDPVDLGRWAGNSVEIIGDNDERWLQFNEQFRDLYADLVPMIHRHDGFALFGGVAAKDNRLYVQICHLIFTRQVLELEPPMRETFGPNFRQRYKDVLPKLYRFQQPRDLATFRT